MDCRVKPGNDGGEVAVQICSYWFHHLMIRVMIYLIIVAALAYGAVWLAERPGEVAITWQGERIDTSVMVLAAAIAAISVAVVFFWSILRAILNAPAAIAHYPREPPGERGHRAGSPGPVAVRP